MTSNRAKDELHLIDQCLIDAHTTSTNLLTWNYKEKYNGDGGWVKVKVIGGSDAFQNHQQTWEKCSQVVCNTKSAGKEVGAYGDAEFTFHRVQRSGYPELSDFLVAVLVESQKSYIDTTRSVLLTRKDRKKLTQRDVEQMALDRIGEEFFPDKHLRMGKKEEVRVVVQLYHDGNAMCFVVETDCAYYALWNSTS